MEKSKERILELITGYLLLIPGFMAVLSVIILPWLSGVSRGRGSFLLNWWTHFLQPMQNNLSFSLIIISMTFAGVYLIKSKTEGK
jgi:hypothetical protein